MSRHHLPSRNPVMGLLAFARTWSIVCASLALLSGMAWSQPLALSLDEAIDRALGSHREGERVHLGLRENKLDRSDLHLRLLPRIRVQGVLPGITDSRAELWNSSLQVYEETRIKTERRSGTLSLSTELPFGTTVDASSYLGWRDSDTDSYLTRWSTNYSLSVSQQIFGARWLWDDLRQESRSLRLSQLQVSEQEAAFRYRVVQAYYALLQARLGLDLGRTGLRESEGSLELARRKYGAGIIGESDFLKSELENLERRSSFASDSLALQLQEEDFRKLVGLPTEQAFILNATVPEPSPSLDVDAQLELARQQSLSLLESRDALSAATRSRREAWRSLLPAVDLALSWDQSIQDSTRNLSMADADLFRTVTLRLNWALWDWGRNTRALQRMRIRERRQQLAFDESVENLERQVRSQLNRILELQAQLPLRARQLDLALRDHQISQQRFETGQITSQDLIDAERTLSSVRLQELSARINLVLQVAALERLTGADRVPLP